MKPSWCKVAIMKTRADTVKRETSTSCKVERQSHGPGVGEGEQILFGREERQLLEALARSPDGEVVASVVGLQTARERESEGEKRGLCSLCVLVWIATSEVCIWSVFGKGSPDCQLVL